jgi:hypothetical protein
MNYLLAKIKRQHSFRKVLSNIALFTRPESLENNLVYNPATLLEDDYWYKIENFAESHFAIDLIKNNFNSTSHNQIVTAEYPKIDFLCFYNEGENTYYFQRITSSNFIKNRWISLGNIPSISENEPIIVINNYADAIYDKNTNTLYFKKLPAIKSFFPGIDSLYREATDAETQAFLDNDFLNISPNFNVSSVKIPNRKRIAMVTDTLNGFTPVQKSDIYGYIQEYCQDLSFEDGAFQIDNEHSLTLVIYGIEQRYYTTQFGLEKRIANSIIKIENN